MHRHPQHKLSYTNSQPLFSFAQNPYNTIAPLSTPLLNVETKTDKPEEIQRIEKNMETDRQKILSITDPIAEGLMSAAPFFGPAASVLGSVAYGAYNYLK
jgi:hypothetical protein